MRRRTWVGALLATAACPTAAEAATYCVAPSGCTHTTIAAAVAAANASSGVADRIEVRAGTHAVPATLDHLAGGGPLEIVGAGRDATILQSSTPTANFAVRLVTGGALSDLTIQLGAGSSRFGLDLTAGTVKRVAVLGPAALASSAAVELRNGADAEDVVVAVAPSPGIASQGIGVDDDDDSRLLRVDVTADYGISVLGSGGGATTVVHGAHVKGRYAALDARGAHLSVDGVIAEVSDASGNAVTASSVGSAPSVITLKHATLRAPAAATGILLAPTINPSSSVVTARETVVVGPSQHARMLGGTGAASKLDIAWSAIDPLRVTQSGAGSKQIVPGPGLIAPFDTGVAATGDATPAPGSPLIDAGEPGEALVPANLLDVLGAPRVRDGNADGVARRDIGAVEAGPPPPPPPPPSGGGGAPASPPSSPASPSPGPTVLPRVALPTFTPPRGGLRLDGKGRVALKLTCSAACSGAVTLKSVKAIAAQRARRRIVTLGTARYELAAGATKTVRVSVSRAMRTYLRRRGRLVVAAHLTAAGAPAKVVPFTLRKAPRRR